jgi:hypothetical protein
VWYTSTTKGAFDGKGRMGKREGIVIASQLPQRNKIVLLDAYDGKMVCVSDRQAVSHGMLLHYYIRHDRNTSFLYASELVATMGLVASYDLLFFHHIMELCYYFLPFDCPVPQVFELLHHLYQTAPLESFEKKIFLCKFFVLIGLYPELDCGDSARMCQLALVPIDRMLSHCVDLGFKEAELDMWLRMCVLAHPYREQFKTIHFLTADRRV